jgi:hypothetical protein
MRALVAWIQAVTAVATAVARGLALTVIPRAIRVATTTASCAHHHLPLHLPRRRRHPHHHHLHPQGAGLCTHDGEVPVARQARHSSILASWQGHITSTALAQTISVCTPIRRHRVEQTKPSRMGRLSTGLSTSSCSAIRRSMRLPTTTRMQLAPCASMKQPCTHTHCGALPMLRTHCPRSTARRVSSTHPL